MKDKNYSSCRVEISIPKALYKKISAQARLKYRSVPEEISFMITETLSSPLQKVKQNSLDFFDELLEHSKKHEAYKGKKQVSQKMKQKTEKKPGNIISIDKKV